MEAEGAMGVTDLQLQALTKFWICCRLLLETAITKVRHAVTAIVFKARRHFKTSVVHRSICMDVVCCQIQECRHGECRHGECHLGISRHKECRRRCSLRSDNGSKYLLLSNATSTRHDDNNFSEVIVRLTHNIFKL